VASVQVTGSPVPPPPPEPPPPVPPAAPPPVPPEAPLPPWRLVAESQETTRNVRGGYYPYCQVPSTVAVTVVGSAARPGKTRYELLVRLSMRTDARTLFQMRAQTSSSMT